MRHSFSGRKVRITLLIIVILLILSAGGIWVYISWPDPPVKELRAASDALMLAREAKADTYAPSQFKNTSQLYELAMNSWKKENDRFILKRDFTRTRAFAQQATLTGKEACRKAIEKASTLHQNTGITLVELEKIRNNFKRIYSPLPLPGTLRNNFNKAILIMSEAKLARERSDLPLAESKLELAKILMVNSETKARTMLEDYFKNLPKWRNQVNAAIQFSASQNTLAIIIDKMEHKCLLYQNGRLRNKFEVELGPNWLGNKTYRGDCATPEGTYRIVHKKDHFKTIYHKALLINYPNEEDRVRYSSSFASGKSSHIRDLGGLIEIHGGGGRGFDWTNGCIALTDKDIDTVYGLVSQNTPVVIVGSLEPLEKYTN